MKKQKLLTYFIQYPDFNYVIDNKKASLTEIEYVIKKHPWKNALKMYKEIEDKMLPSLEVISRSKEIDFDCILNTDSTFEVSFLDPSIPHKKGIQRLIHKIFSPGGSRHKINNCSTEKTIHWLRLWYKLPSNKLLKLLRNKTK